MKLLDKFKNDSYDFISNATITQIVKLIRDANKAYYGRNWEAGRAFTPSEARRLAAPLAEMPEEYANTHLAKVAKLLNSHRYYDNMISRIKSKIDENGNMVFPEIEALYKNYEENIRKYDILQEALDRSSIRGVLKSSDSYPHRVMREKLWYP